MSTILTFAKGFVTVLNFGFPLFLAVVGALALKYSTDISDAQVLSCPALDLMYKKNFGYLYGIYGKGLYTFLIGIFAFGLSGGNVNKEVEKLSQAAAVLVAAWGIVIMLIHTLYPDFFDKKEKYQP